MSYQLWYWPDVPGRGEFIRLALEAAEVEYEDMARERGAEALVEDMASRTGFRPFAPPYLVIDDDLCIGQTAHILAVLADRHDFGAGDLETDLHLIQLQLDISDIVAEVHSVHHPISGNLYYQEQMDAAFEAAHQFRETRIPKFLDHFEAALEHHGGPFVLGDHWTHVDTSLFQVMEGLDYMFPNQMRSLDYPRLELCRQSVLELDSVEAYLASDRRLEFNQDGIFRHYPELDSE
ncbi:MAG TPA: glutathione S-transferase [Croceibacterium sp.]|nr:glutathione S-transferase [Croceibacterium sp.]